MATAADLHLSAMAATATRSPRMPTLRHGHWHLLQFAASPRRVATPQAWQRPGSQPKRMLRAPFGTGAHLCKPTGAAAASYQPHAQLGQDLSVQLGRSRLHLATECRKLLPERAACETLVCDHACSLLLNKNPQMPNWCRRSEGSLLE